MRLHYFAGERSDEINSSVKDVVNFLKWTSEEGYSVIVRANNVLPKGTDSFSSMNVCRSF